MNMYNVIGGLALALAAVTVSAQEAAPATAELAGVGLAGPAAGAYLEPVTLSGDGEAGANYQAGNRLLDEISSRVAGDLDARMERELELDAPADSRVETRLVSSN